MPLAIADASHVPPQGGFRMKHPISGQEFRKHYVDGVIALYLEHCEENGYPLPTQQECIDIICSSTKATICHDTEQPTIVQKMVSFAKDMGKWAASGFAIVTQEQLTERLTICQNCPFFGGETGGHLVSARCKKCGCSGLKLALSTSKCPISKWLPI